MKYRNIGMDGGSKNTLYRICELALEVANFKRVKISSMKKSS